MVVQRKKAETETESGFIIPGAEEKKLNEGIIVATGPECSEYIKNGEYVIFDAFAAKEIPHEGMLFAVIEESDIIVFVRGDEASA